ncbi:MAG: hypothetical protein ACREGR_02005 [Minisyncoccia bacterium]
MSPMSAGDKRHALSYAIEFVRFSAGFSAIIALALISLHFATVAGQ